MLTWGNYSIWTTCICIIRTLLLKEVLDVFLRINTVCYSTCDLIKSFKAVIQSNNAQERDSSIFKSVSGKGKKTLHFRVRMQELQSNCKLRKYQGFGRLVEYFTCQKCLLNAHNNLRQKGKLLLCLLQNKTLLVCLQRLCGQEGPRALWGSQTSCRRRREWSQRGTPVGLEGNSWHERRHRGAQTSGLGGRTLGRGVLPGCLSHG